METLTWSEPSRNTSMAARDTERFSHSLPRTVREDWPGLAHTTVVDPSGITMRQNLKWEAGASWDWKG